MEAHPRNAEEPPISVDSDTVIEERHGRAQAAGVPPGALIDLVGPPDPEGPRPPVGRVPRPRRRRIALTILAVLGLVLAVPALSLFQALRAPGNLTATEKTVEWMRDHDLGPVVNSVERWWFSNHQPKEGGEPDRAIGIEAPPAQSTGSAKAVPEDRKSVV
jgi:hypothetical protein